MLTIRLLTAATCVALTSAAAAAPDHPPVAAVKPVIDDYFGTKITDPYRWMETQPKPDFLNYLHAENDYARGVLATIPGRDQLAKDIGEVSGLASRVRNVVIMGGQVFFLRRDAGGQIDRLYVRNAAGHETLLVDPATLDAGGKHAEIDQFAPSQDGSLVVYGISVGGSENSVLHILETATRKTRPDVIDRAQFANVSWLPDGTGFLFTRLPAGAAAAAATEQYAHMKVFLHCLGQNPDLDKVVLDADHLPFGFSAAAIFPSVSVTPGSAYALASLLDGVSRDATLFSAPLKDVLGGAPAWKKVAQKSDGVIDVAVRGDRVDLMTHLGAGRFRIVQTGLAAPDFAAAKTIVPEQKGVLTGMAAAQDGLYFAARDGAVFTLHRLDDGATMPESIPLPFAGTIAPDGSEGGLVSDPRAPGVLISLESWVRPHVWLAYDPAAKTTTDAGILSALPRDLSGYESVETFATAADGTKIPLSIVMKKGLKHDGKRPTYLVGYGSYGISYDPNFAADFLPWLDRGGVYAIAHVRGGGEGGQAWHDGGKIATKQNTVHDFIACAEALIKLHYTDSAHLGGEGTSAGGILIGGAITQRPDLFRAALIRVGATNTIREEYTAGGPANTPEFGTVRNRQQFPSMLAMDAYNNVKKGVAYPAVLLTGGANDPRVTVWIPAKMTARLQASSSSGRPVLFRVEFDAGHGIGSTRTQRDAETADEFAFLLWQFGEKGFQPGK
jgi:prolyl oligopeptidase